MSKFIYWDTALTKIEDKEFFVLYILESNKHLLFKIYKLRNDEIENKLLDLKPFSDVTDNINYVIKRNNQISLDIIL